MHDKLRQILDTKREEVARLRPRVDLLRAAALERNEYRSLAQALSGQGDSLSLIAEVKRASPSAGVIATRFDPVAIARTYEAAGANAISVLTDERYFEGQLADLTRVRKAVSLPVLRKDFIIDPVQIYEAAVAGADAILLIVAALEQSRFEELYEIAQIHQLEVLVEVHDLAELERALDAGAQIVGVNNRNLKTFEVDLSTTKTLAEEFPPERILVSESGIKTREDARNVRSWGADAILVGESLMRAADVIAQARALRLLPVN